MKPDQSIRSIQRRLFILLLRAFATSVLLTLLFVFIVAAIFLAFPSRYNPTARISIVSRLETYFLVQGDWKGVETLVSADTTNDDHQFWQNSLVLDEQGRIVLDRGRADTPRTGSLYTPAEDDFDIPILLEDQQIGSLIVDPSFLPAHGLSALIWLKPVGFVSLVMAIPTTLIGLLLMRRLVTPLAEVIAAARAVAAGDLSARVPVSGPDDLRALSDSFNHMAAALELSDRERRDLLADIAHELRTPLTVIRGRLEGVVDGVYPPDERQIVPALEETYLLERLVEDLRLLTLAETRKLQFEPRDVSLGDLAGHVLRIFAAEAEEKNISLQLENNAPQAQVHVDPQRSEQVIGNLIGNALRYVPVGGKVWLVVDRMDDAVRLQVNDNGPGMPAEDLPHLFERFWRGEKSRSRASGGAGLGLAIACQLVEAQGGAISAKNLPAAGLQVSITFPLVSGHGDRREPFGLQA
jgi:two-component system OmpR family sensor kinase/two-component system sensor histidine kinase BaeS